MAITFSYFSNYTACCRACLWKEPVILEACMPAAFAPFPEMSLSLRSL